MLRLLVRYCRSCLAAVLSTGAGLCTFFLWVQPVGAGLMLDGNSLFRMGEKENLCAVTFDDGPSQHTAQLLDILREQQIPATFFVLGTQIDRRPQLIERMRAEGHEIANHTTTHVTLRHLGIDRQREELKQVQDMLQALGVTSLYLRPPFGRYDSNTLKVAKELGLRVAMWSVDSFDWKRQAAMSNMRSVAGGPTLRGVFLFHDTHKPTIAAMPNLLNEMRANGCRFVTLSDFLAAGEASVNSAPHATPTAPGTSDGLPAGATPGQSVPAHDGLPKDATPPTEPSPHWSVSAIDVPAKALKHVREREAAARSEGAGGKPSAPASEEGFWPFFKNSNTFRQLSGLVEQVFTN